MLYISPRACANPFHLTTCSNAGGRPATVHQCRKLRALGILQVAPGDMLCKRCREHLSQGVKDQDTQASEEQQAGRQMRPRKRSSTSDEPVDEEVEALPKRPKQSDSQELWQAPPQMSQSPTTVAARITEINAALQALGLGVISAKQTFERRVGFAQKKASEDYVKLYKLYQKVLLPPDLRAEHQRAHPDPDYSGLLEAMKARIATVSSRRDLIAVLTLVPDSWTVSQVVAYFGVTKYSVRQARHLRAQYGLLSQPELRRGHGFSGSVVDAIHAFVRLDSISRISPHLRDCVAISVGFLPSRRLNSTLHETYTLFKEAHQNITIGFSTFCKHLPRDVRRSVDEHKVCVCVICQNLKFMLEPLTIESIEELHLLGACGDASEDCATEHCSRCDYNAIEASLRAETEDSCDEEVSFWMWKTIDSRVQLSEETCTIGELITKVTTSFSRAYRFHRYVKVKQRAFYQKKLVALLQGEVLVVLDFAENYSFLLQEEVTSHYYARAQCSLLTIAVYYMSSSGQMEHLTYCGVTEDLLHDSAPVLYGIHWILREVSKTTAIELVNYFSDGARQHFKNRTMALVVLGHEMLFGCRARWHFHASHHGKSVCDGIGAVVKRSIRAHSLRCSTRPIRSVDDVIAWSSSNPRLAIGVSCSQFDLSTSILIHLASWCPPGISQEEQIKTQRSEPNVVFLFVPLGKTL